MNNNFKSNLEKYCLNKKNISTILKCSQTFMNITQKEKNESKPKNKKHNKKYFH